MDGVSRGIESYSAFRGAGLVISIAWRIALGGLGLFKAHSLVLVVPSLIGGLLFEDARGRISLVTFTAVDAAGSMWTDGRPAFSRLDWSTARAKGCVVFD